ncbi:MAG: cysteine desulfurase NifS [Candidatus Gastranaerophilales bacterium]|nr:cysteine desulfurase NifS [Candidatus Gastranaerophilales bacterium]
MEKCLVYLDNNATTKVDERVFEKMIPFLTEKYGNPSSMHEFGGEISHDVAKAREQVADLLGAANDYEITFTGCGTESANIAIKGALEINKEKKHIITTKVEHPCVLNLYKWLEKRGYRTTYIGVNSEGELDLDELKHSITDDTALVSVMWANNETGVVFPVEKIANMIKEINPKTLFFVDAVQACGKIPIDVKNTKIDMLGIAGHKFHAPKGVGALYVRRGIMLPPLMLGGHQERSLRPGTENVASIVGMGEAAVLAKEYLYDEATRVFDLRNQLEKGILSTVFNARVNSAKALRVPNTSNISFEYIEGELILLHFSQNGICASSGSACTSGSLEPSHVLKAMGIPFTALHGSIRFSLSRYTTQEEIDYTLKMIPDIIKKINSYSPYQKELKELCEIRKNNKNA